MAQFSRKTTEIDAILDDVEAAVQGHESLENAINTLYAGMNAARTKMVIKGEVDYYNDLTQLDSPMIGDTYTVKYKGDSGSVAYGRQFTFVNFYSLTYWLPLGQDLTPLETAVASLTNRMGGLSFVKISKSDFDAIPVKDQNTVYYVYDTSGKVTPYYADQDIGGGGGNLMVTAITSPSFQSGTPTITEEVS